MRFLISTVIILYFILFLISCKNEKIKNNSLEIVNNDTIKEKIIASNKKSINDSLSNNENSLNENNCNDAINKTLKFYKKNGTIKKFENNIWFCDIENDTIKIGIIIENCRIKFRSIINNTNNSKSSAKYDDKGKLVLFDSTNQKGELIIFYALGFRNYKDRSKLPVYLKREDN